MRISRTLVPLIIVLALWLAACGSTPTTTPAAGVSVTATTTAAASPSATAQTNGCTTQHIPVDPLPPAQVVATQQSGGNPTMVSLSTGQSVEIHLSSSFSWHLNLADPNQILNATALEGWYSKSLNACVWRYSATKTGTATLTFTGAVLCQPGKPCSQLAVETDFAVTVK